MEAAALWQNLVEALPLTVMRVLAWLLVGSAIALATGLVGVIASLAVDERHDRACIT